MSSKHIDKSVEQITRELEETRDRVMCLEAQLRGLERIETKHIASLSEKSGVPPSQSSTIESNTSTATTLAAESVLHSTAQWIATTLLVEACTISQWDREADSIATVVSYARRPEHTAFQCPTQVHPLSEWPALREALIKCRTLVVQAGDPESLPISLCRLNGEAKQSLLAVPMIVHGETVGCIELMADREKPTFSEAAIDLCQSLANQAGITLGNAHRQIETERRLAEQIALREASATILTALDLEVVLTRIVEQMARLIDATSAYVCSYDPDTQQSTVLAEYIGPSASDLERISDLGQVYTEGNAASMQALHSNKPYASIIGMPDLHPSDRAKMEECGGTAVLYIPLWAKERLIGYVELWETQGSRVFSPDEISLCTGIAQQASIAFENARLYEQAQREIFERRRAQEQLRYRNMELSLLNRIITESAAHQQADTMLETMCRELAQAFGYAQVAAVLIDEARATASVVSEFTSDRGVSFRGVSIPIVGNPLMQYMDEYQAPLVIEDAQSDDRLAFARHLMQHASAVSVVLVPLVVDGAVIGALVTADDPRKFSTGELALVWRVAEQTSNSLARIRLQQLQKHLEEQLRHAQKMEALGQMAGGVAHDFNNLLTIMRVSSQLMQRRLQPDDPLWENVEHLSHAITRAADLTGRLLSFSRKEVIEPQTLILNQLVTQLEFMLRRVVGETIELRLDLFQDLWLIKADPTQMDQILVNLVLNGRGAMPSGGTISIKTSNVILDQAYVSAHVDSRLGPHVLLCVSDTGVGMDDEVKAHLFEPFYTTKERGRGTGLGLATVYGIVKQNGGHIELESEPCQGTTFRVYLPRTNDGEVETHPPSASPISSEHGSETILLAEDEALVRRLVQEILENTGYRVLAASDGQEALEVSDGFAGCIDLLLTDVVMPKMNGKELAQRLRQQRPDTRVLYMSGNSDNLIRQDGALEPGAAFLAKPLSVHNLLYKVREIIEKDAPASSR